MHRVAVVIMAAALAAVPSPGVTAASFATPGATFDLSPQLMLRFFGETSDSRASLAAAYGDRGSESPLRDLALRDETTRRQTAAVQAFAGVATFIAGAGSQPAQAQSPFEVARALRNRALQTGAHFALPTLSPDAASSAPADIDASALPAATFTVGAYQPMAPVPLSTPQPGTFAFGPDARGAAMAFGEDPVLAIGEGNVVGASGSSAAVPSSLRVGPLQVRTRMESAALAAPQLSLQDTGYGAGANFDVRAGARNVNVDLSSNYERLTRNDPSASSSALGASSSWQLPGADAPLVIPNYADMSKLSVGAALAVPVVHGLTLNLNYGAERMFGGYGLPGVTNLDATDNTYGGKLTLQIPNSSSTLSISARSLRYQDNVLPANTFTQTREDVNFTVKF